MKEIEENTPRESGQSASSTGDGGSDIREGGEEGLIHQIAAQTDRIVDREFLHVIQETIKIKADNQVKVTLEDLARKKNIILTGLNEGPYDLDNVYQMLEEIGFGRATRHIVRVTRLGTFRGGRKRPVKVEFDSEKCAKDILFYSKRLYHTENFYAVYINKDLSREEREKEKRERLAKKGNYYNEMSAGTGSGRTEEAEESRVRRGAWSTRRG